MPMPEKRWEFGPSVHGLFVEVLGEDLGPWRRDRLRELGLDLDRPLLPAYPAEQYVACLRFVARELAPEVDEEEALRRLGRRAVLGLRRSMLGKPVISLFSMLGIRRTLRSLSPAYRTANNYIQVRVRELGPRCLEIEFSTVTGIPSFFEGTFLSGVEMLGGREVRVESRSEADERWTYRITWEE